MRVAARCWPPCGNPPGIDGDLTNNWKALPDAEDPDAGGRRLLQRQHRQPVQVTKWPAPVECTASHTVETVYVGQFTGEEASQSSAPSTGSKGRRTAYETCAAEAKTFLGDDWRNGRLELSVVLPIALHWQGGARWFRCDMMEYLDLDDYAVVHAHGEPEGRPQRRPAGRPCRASRSPLASNNRIDKMTPTKCDTNHNGEYVGVLRPARRPVPDRPGGGVEGPARRLRAGGGGVRGRAERRRPELPHRLDLLAVHRDRVGPRQPWRAVLRAQRRPAEQVDQGHRPRRSSRRTEICAAVALGAGRHAAS